MCSLPALLQEREDNRRMTAEAAASSSAIEAVQHRLAVAEGQLQEVRIILRTQRAGQAAWCCGGVPARLT